MRRKKETFRNYYRLPAKDLRVGDFLHIPVLDFSREIEAVFAVDVPGGLLAKDVQLVAIKAGWTQMAVPEDELLAITRIEAQPKAS